MELKKNHPNYYHDAQIKYQKTLKAITLRIKPAEFERYAAAAKERGYSLRRFILEAIEEKIKRG